MSGDTVAERLPRARRRHDPHLARWRGRDDIAQVLLPVGATVTPAFVSKLVARARDRGCTTVISGAVDTRQELVLRTVGFRTLEHLHLLVRALDDEPPRPSARVRRARRSDRAAMVAVDDRAFDEFWRLGPTGLRDATRAVPVSRVRIGAGSTVRSYAITGHAGAVGYLQRVAVDPDERRRGWGRALVDDALHWLWARGATSASVNTQHANDAAFALYVDRGFVIDPAGLCVLELSL